MQGVPLRTGWTLGKCCLQVLPQVKTMSLFWQQQWSSWWSPLASDRAGTTVVEIFMAWGHVAETCAKVNTQICIMCAERCLHELTVGLGLLQSGETLLHDKQRHIHKLTKKAQRKKKGQISNTWNAVRLCGLQSNPRPTNGHKNHSCNCWMLNSFVMFQKLLQAEAQIQQDSLGYSQNMVKVQISYSSRAWRWDSIALLIGFGEWWSRQISSRVGVWSRWMDNESIMSGGDMEGRAVRTWAHIPVVASMDRNPQHGAKEWPVAMLRLCNPICTPPSCGQGLNCVLAAASVSACASNCNGWKDLGSVLFALFISYKCNYQGIN